MRRVFRDLIVTIGTCMVLLSGGIGTVAAFGQGFSFAVLADPRYHGESWKNALSEIRDLSVNPDPAFARADLVLVAGDMDPLSSRYDDFLRVFPDASPRPLFLPVIGNHDLANGGEPFRYARDVLIPLIPGVVRRHASSCDYYLDHQNVRFIVVDAYTDLGEYGVITAKGRQWVERVIQTTPPSINHIFISFHEPAFPRSRHIKDSFNRDPEQRNAFWRMLVKQGAKVRAVFVGHTHSYSRMRVMDPAGTAANDPHRFPDENGGIYQVDAGAAGNGDVNTVVQVQISGNKVIFRVVQAKNGANKPFSVVDSWSIDSGPRVQNEKTK